MTDYQHPMAPIQLVLTDPEEKDTFFSCCSPEFLGLDLVATTWTLPEKKKKKKTEMHNIYSVQSIILGMMEMK